MTASFLDRRHAVLLAPILSVGVAEAASAALLAGANAAMTAVLVAIAGLGLEPKLVVLIALPIYLSLIASEALAATRLSGDSSAMPAAATTEAF